MYLDVLELFLKYKETPFKNEISKGTTTTLHFFHTILDWNL